MVAVVLGMLVCVGLAVWVVSLVAVPARREGRDLLTERGEQLVARMPALLGGEDHRGAPGSVPPAAAASAGPAAPDQEDAARQDAARESVDAGRR